MCRQSAGASLVVIYKNEDPSKPLKSVVIYNGLYTQIEGCQDQDDRQA